jgi:hypothetical protein
MPGDQSGLGRQNLICESKGAPCEFHVTIKAGEVLSWTVLQISSVCA